MYFVALLQAFLMVPSNELVNIWKISMDDKIISGRLCQNQPVLAANGGHNLS